MMKNKKNIYILLPLVLLIWAAVMYQFFSFSSPDDTTLTSSNDFKLKPFEIKKRDSVAINVNYRDPFLGKLFVVQNSNSSALKKKTNIKKAKVVVEVPELVWPKTQYKGIVSDTKDKIKVYMLIIDGQTFLMKKGETQKGVFLKEGDRESIYIQYKGKLDLILID
jgi:hypothetical protein